MKLKCVKDSYITTCGVFRKTSIQVKVEGITPGRSYHAVSYSEANIQTYRETNPRFLVFNDAGKWEVYLPEHFVPEGT